MSHWGNVPAELVEQVRELHRIIGNQSYSATHLDNHDKFTIEIHLIDWRDRSGFSLLCEASRLLFRVFYPKKAQ